MKAFLFITALTISYGLSAFAQGTDDYYMLGDFVFEGQKNHDQELSIRIDGTVTHSTWGKGNIRHEGVGNQYVITFPNHADEASGSKTFKCTVHITNLPPT